jgi:hypothetical protein
MFVNAMNEVYLGGIGRYFMHYALVKVRVIVIHGNTLHTFGSVVNEK